MATRTNTGLARPQSGAAWKALRPRRHRGARALEAPRPRGLRALADQPPQSRAHLDAFTRGAIWGMRVAGPPRADMAEHIQKPGGRAVRGARSARAF